MHSLQEKMLQIQKAPPNTEMLQVAGRTRETAGDTKRNDHSWETHVVSSKECAI